VLRACNKPDFRPCAPVAATLLTDWGMVLMVNQFPIPREVANKKEDRSFPALFIAANFPDFSGPLGD